MAEFAQFLPIALSLAGQLFGGGDDDIQQGEEEKRAALMRMFGEAKGFEMPFMKAGQFAIPGLESLAGRLGDPVGSINQILSQFQMSPSQKNIQQSAMSNVQNQLASQGLIGSGLQRSELAKTAGQTAAGFQQQFLQNVLGQQQSQAQILQNLLGTGAGAAGTLTQAAMQTGGGLGSSFEMGGAANAAESQRQQNIFGTLGGAIGSLFGGSGGGAGSFGSNIWLDPDTGQFQNIGR